MKKGLSNLCNGERSTSILEGGGMARVSSRQATLEEMIAQLEMEEKQGRKGKVEEVEQRMSCVSSSDILRSARNAVLNQYPRFSLDGKDAMYRSSFTTMKLMLERDHRKTRRLPLPLPSVIGGESVIWCKPGVVGRLMGLDAMPIPLNATYTRKRLSAITPLLGSCSRARYSHLHPTPFH